MEEAGGLWMESGKTPESFLDLYMRYTAMQESPELFHLWTGISVLAAVMGRKCYIDKGYYKLFPNLFVILVAGSAKCRKSTGINIGIDLLKILIKDIKTTKIISGKITPERFLDELQVISGQPTSPNLLVHSSELSVFLTKQSYGESLIHILTDLYDCHDEWHYQTKHSGEVHLKDVFLCILAATTPDGISSGIPQQALAEGFASRVIFVYQPSTDRVNALPELSLEEIEQFRILADMLRIRAKLAGRFDLSPEARTWYKDWYAGFMKEEAPDKRMEGMWGRKHDHLLRIGMVFAGSYNVKVLEVHHLEAALMCLDTVERFMPGAFAELGGDELTPHMARARSILRKHGRLAYSELLKKLYPMRAPQVKEIVETLIQGGECERDDTRASMLVWKG